MALSLETNAGVMFPKGDGVYRGKINLDGEILTLTSSASGADRLISVGGATASKLDRSKAAPLANGKGWFAGEINVRGRKWVAFRYTTCIQMIESRDDVSGADTSDF